MEPQTQKKSNGALVGSIVIIIILLLGGYYIWKSNVEKALDEKKVQQGDTDIGELNTLEKSITETQIDLNANVLDSVE